MGPFRRGAKTREEESGRSGQIAATVEVRSCNYRRLGDDRALLSVELQAGGGLHAGIRLRSQTHDEVHELAPAAVTLLPESASARLLFILDRIGPALAADRLELSIEGEPTVGLPAPSELPAIGTPGGDLDHAVASSLAGDQLQGVATMLERRCATAERALEDLRDAPSEARKLAQAYRESWELRALLDEREAAYLQSNAVVEAADAARRDAESAGHAVRTELDEARAERDRIQTELLEELELRGDAIARLEAAVAESVAAVEAWAVEAERARTQLVEAVARAEALEAERDEARGAGERLEGELAEAFSRAQTAAEEVAELRARLAEVAAGANAFESERDAARADAQRLEAELAGARAEANAAAAEADAARAAVAAETEAARAAVAAETEAARAAVAAETEDAREDLADAVARAGMLERQRDEARASATSTQEELAASRALLAETEGVLDRERKLYEGRIVSGVESERKLRSRVDELETRLAEERSSRGTLQRRKDSIAKSFADAQRTRLREATLEEQRAQVAALERQLEQIKERSAEPAADDVSAPTV